MRVWDVINQKLMNPLINVEKVSRSFWARDMGATVTEVAGDLQYTSRIGGCRRALYYRIYDYPKTEPAETWRSYWVKNNGHVVESMAIEILKQARVYVGDEVPISMFRRTPGDNIYEISGRIDGVIQDPYTGKPVFIEFKSKGTFSPKTLYGPSGNKQMMPEPSEVCQVMPYLYWASISPQDVEDPAMHMCYTTRDGMTGEHVIRINKEGNAVIENDSGIFEWHHLNIHKMLADADATVDNIFNHEIPDRDYMIVWDNAKIDWLYRTDQLRATDKKIVEKKKAANEGGTWIEGSDSACHFCAYKSGCWGDDPNFVPGRNLMSKSFKE